LGGGRPSGDQDTKTGQTSRNVGRCRGRRGEKEKERGTGFSVGKRVLSASSNLAAESAKKKKAPRVEKTRKKKREASGNIGGKGEKETWGKTFSSDLKKKESPSVSHEVGWGKGLPSDHERKKKVSIGGGKKKASSLRGPWLEEKGGLLYLVGGKRKRIRRKKGTWEVHLI